MIGEDFTYGSHSLSDFGLIMIQPENEDNSGLNREIIKGSTTIQRYEANHFGAKYSEPISINFFVIKSSCQDDSYIISDDELRRIYSWLTFTHLPSSLFVDFKNSSTKEFKGIFSQITPYIVNGMNGLKLTFTNISPFAYEKNELLFNNTLSDYSQLFDCTSDENTYIYPEIRIKPVLSGLTGEYSIENEDELKTMSFTLSSDYVEYVFDCKTKRIFAFDSEGDKTILSLSDVNMTITETTNINSIGSDMVTMYWLRFLPGINHLVFNGNGNFRISCNSPVKIGGYPYD